MEHHTGKQAKCTRELKPLRSRAFFWKLISDVQVELKLRKFPTPSGDITTFLNPLIVMFIYIDTAARKMKANASSLRSFDGENLRIFF